MPWSAELLRSVIEAAPEGIVICEARGAESPVIYANAAFVKLSGYPLAELQGHDLRRLQGGDTGQPGCTLLRTALAAGQNARALLRNYRKDGSQFWNEVLIEPVRDASGTITHFVGFHRDVSERGSAGVAGTANAGHARAANGAAAPPTQVAGLPSWMREDRLSGLCSRAYFEELLRHDWQVGQREARSLTLMLFDIDGLGTYNATFGRAAGDACIRRVAGVIVAAFRRGTDVIARWEGGTLCALVRSTDPEASAAFAQSIAQRVQAQHIHHPRSSRQKFVTVSAAVAHMVPSAKVSPDALVAAATRALRRAQAEKSGEIAIACTGDFQVITT